MRKPDGHWEILLFQRYLIYPDHQKNILFVVCIATMFLIKGEEEGVFYLEKEKFANDLKERYRGNTELLKAIEKCLNRNSMKNNYVSMI